LLLRFLNRELELLAAAFAKFFGFGHGVKLQTSEVF
jgi:hypothetical protein